MKSTLRATLAVLLIAAISVCAVLIGRKAAGRARIDLTEHRLYTLSQGTRNVLSKLSQPIELRLYYSAVGAMKAPEGIRFYSTYYQYVRDLLSEYEGLANGKLIVKVIDPRPFSQEEEDAIKYGAKRFQISKDESFFFCLVVLTQLGKSKAIPFFEPDRQEFVEYDISKLISSVTKRDKKKIGVISSLNVMGSDTSPEMMQMYQMQGRQPEEPWTIVTHLRDEYEVAPVERETESIDPDVDFLMVVHPKNLPEKTLFAIDQFVMKGGKLMVFVDPHCLLDRPQQQQMMMNFEQSSSSDLNALLKGWGVEVDPDLIVTDRELAITAAIQRNRPPLPILTFLQLDQENVNKDEVAVANLHSLRLLFAGAIKKVDGAGSTVTPLLTSSNIAGLWKPGSPFELQMVDPQAIMREAHDGTQTLTLACRIGGKLKTNFPNGPKKEEKKDDGSDESKEDDEAKKEDKASTESVNVVKESGTDAMVLVFADVDMMTDMLAYEESFFGMAQAGDNASLVLNGVDFLSGDADLIAIRSRGRFERPFTVVDKIEMEAEKATADEVNRINGEIGEFEKQLDKLGRAATEENITLIQKSAVQEREKIEAKMRAAQKRLRELNAKKREKIEALEQRIQTANLLLAPAVILAIAVVLAVVRWIKAKRYVARRVE